jgi:vacuolar-type H+-ATPase subunit F/Vma7
VDYILDSGILYFVIAFFIIRHLWKVYINPAAVLGRQAANMNWVVSGRAEDSDEYKNVRYVRDNMEAVVSFQNGNVILTKPNHLEPFKDFIEIERYIATKDEESNDEIVVVKSDAIQELEDEVQNWTDEQAVAALLILKAAIKGDDKIMIREYFSKLTFGHLEYVDKILTKIAIETGNEDYLTYIEKEEQEDKDEKEFMEAYGDWLFAVETYMTVRDKHIFVTELMEADEDFGYRVYALYDAGFKHKAEPSIIACQVIDAAENKYGEDYDKCLLDLLISATYLNEGKRDKLYQYSDSDGRTSYWDS